MRALSIEKYGNLYRQFVVCFFFPYFSPPFALYRLCYSFGLCKLVFFITLLIILYLLERKARFFPQIWHLNM